MQLPPRNVFNPTDQISMEWYGTMVDWCAVADWFVRDKVEGASCGPVGHKIMHASKSMAETSGKVGDA